MAIPKTRKEIEEIINKITYKQGWEIRLIDKAPDTFLVQVRFMAPDTFNPSGPAELQACRKWFVSVYSTESEIIRTVYLAICQAEQHEIDETFKFNGARVFNPHIDLVKLSEELTNIGDDVRD